MRFVDAHEFVPTWLFIRVRNVVFSLRIKLFYLLSFSGFFSSFYYCFFSAAFRREHQAVTHGIWRYLGEVGEVALFAQLRRNVHRIEKGLLMRPRKKVYALEYIEQTVDCFQKCKLSSFCNLHSFDLAWANDVLRLYFAVVETHPRIELARKRFAECAIETTGELVPYHRVQTGDFVSFDNFRTLAQYRKSIRWFEQKAVPRELLEQAVQVAALAPSACNRQPFMFKFYDDPQILPEISKIPHGTQGFADNIPVVCAVVGDLSAYAFERDRHVVYVDGSLAAMTFMLALETLGLGSCPLNWPDISEREALAAKKLKLKPYQRIVMFLAIGYPSQDGMVACSSRKGIEELRSFN